MKENKEYRNQAAAKLDGSWFMAALAILIVSVMRGCFGGIMSDNPFLYAPYGIFQILILPLEWGLSILFLDLIRGKSLAIENLFDGFKDYGRIMLTLLLQYVYIVLWTVLLIVPGIIKSYSYSMTSFIMKDNKEIKYNDAIELSMAMMHGYKMKLFLLDLSFIGWALLCLCTCGIGFFFLSPYVRTAHAAFYEDLRQNGWAEEN